MQVEYFTKISFTGNEEEKRLFTDILKLYSNRDKRAAFFEFDSDEINKISVDDSKTVEIEAYGPYGYYMVLNDVDIFRELAEAVPNAQLKGFIDGNGTYERQSLKARLTNGKLYIKTYLLNNGEYEEYRADKLPYKKFISLFRIEGDEFDEEAYTDFLDLVENDETICDISFDDFTKYVSETEIEEDEYIEVLEQIRQLGILSYDDYYENGGGAIERLVYDPISKHYGSGTVIPKGPFDATGILSEQLEKEGRQEDPSELSLEDVYALMANALEKEEDDKDTIEFFNVIFNDDFWKMMEEETMASFEIAISIKNKILADVLNKYKAVINQDYFPYGNCSEIDVTIDGDIIMMSQNGEDRTLDPSTPSALESLVYVLINFLDQGETDAAANLDTQVKDDGVNPENLNVEKYGPIGQLYKELYEKEEEIIRQMVSVNWSSNVEDWEEEYFAENQQFTYDQENGAKYTHEVE